VALALTPRVLIVNVAVFVPPGIESVAGTVAAAVLLLVSVTVVPPEGAFADKVTVAVELFPPTTEVGLRDRAETF
jgi:hypothetical protein